MEVSLEQLVNLDLMDPLDHVVPLECLDHLAHVEQEADPGSLDLLDHLDLVDLRADLELADNLDHLGSKAAEDLLVSSTCFYYISYICIETMLDML